MQNLSLLEALRIDTQQLEKLLKDQEANAENDKQHQQHHEYMQHVSTASEMLVREYSETDTLLSPILPRQGVVALVGSSDSGKSSLLRGLAMAIVAGKCDYIGFSLNPRYGRAIYVSTEDDEASLSKLMRMQIMDDSADNYEGLHFIFDTDNLLATLELGMQSHRPDVVIVDAFADLYTGPLNENNRVRSFLNSFSQLAVKYNTLIIFLHHTGKRTESLAPSKHNAIGSQGFEAKMRLVMELRPDPERHDIRHLCIVKGNYLSAEYKHDSFELRFTPELNFEATGERVPFAQLREHNEERDERADLARAMRQEGKSYRQIAEELGYKSISSIHTLLKQE
jgi:RecA-family ATPase